MKNYINDNGNKFLKSVVLGCVFGIISMIILTLIFSFIVASANTSHGAVNIFSMIIIGASAFVCGFSSAKINKEKILIVGVASGVALYFLIGIISMIITKNAFSGTFIIRMVISVISSAIGAILSAFLIKKNGYF